MTFAVNLYVIGTNLVYNGMNHTRCCVFPDFPAIGAGMEIEMHPKETPVAPQTFRFTCPAGNARHKQQ